MTLDKVVDTSALAAAVFREPRASEAVSRLSGQNLFAPSLLRFEMAHICLKKINERPKERHPILSQFAASLQLQIRLAAIDHEETVDLAQRFKLSAYDASYLWLARKLGVELVTFDSGLAKAAAKI